MYVFLLIPTVCPRPPSRQWVPLISERLEGQGMLTDNLGFVLNSFSCCTFDLFSTSWVFLHNIIIITHMQAHACAHGLRVIWTQLYHIFLYSFPGTFSVMCYNVLCDKYCTSQLYGYCPSWALNWEYRKSSILKEILDYSADIVSLQVWYVIMLPRNCHRDFSSNNKYNYPAR